METDAWGHTFVLRPPTTNRRSIGYGASTELRAHPLSYSGDYSKKGTVSTETASRERRSAAISFMLTTVADTSSLDLKDID